MKPTVTWATVGGRRKCVAIARNDRGQVIARVTIQANFRDKSLRKMIEAEARQIVGRLARNLR